ncbi:MAG: tetratricopeptide repeat protein [Elusimicrobiota bacterium]|jgi:tetratricopeptide (TPR) repeat protein
MKRRPHPKLLSAGLDLSFACLLVLSAAYADGLRIPEISPERSARLGEELAEARRSGEYRQALSKVRSLLRAFPDRPEYLQAEAELLEELENYRGAAAAWEAFWIAAPLPAEACPNIGRDYERAGLAARAVEAHRRCSALDARRPDLLFYLGLAFEHNGRDADAERLYLQSLSFSSDYSDALLGLARLRMRRDRRGEAETLVRRVLARSPRNADALFCAANLARDAGDLAGAESYLKSAILAAPSYADLYRALARVQERRSDPHGALQTYEALLELSPDDKPALQRLALLRNRER